MNYSYAQSGPAISEDLQALVESLNRDLPTIGAQSPQQDSGLSPEQFDSLIASW